MAHGSAGTELSPFRAGLACRCPRCGRGRICERLLDTAERCSVCGLPIKLYDSGDGPAVLLIFVLGAITVILAWIVDVRLAPPLWVHAVIWGLVMPGGAALLLRPAKATFIAFDDHRKRHDDNVTD
jgi:uncharacterized protein (DUF983 family)